MSSPATCVCGREDSWLRRWQESISLAFLLLLEQLQPVERAVFLLREVFEYDYAEMTTMLSKSEVTCRQWFSRAKKHLAEHRPRFQASPETQRQLLTGFLQAVQEGSMTALMNLLAEDVTFWADGGGKVRGAARKLDLSTTSSPQDPPIVPTMTKSTRYSCHLPNRC